MDDQLTYTPAQASLKTGIPEETIRAAIRSGDLALTPIEINGRTIRKQIVSHSDLQKWLGVGS